MGEYCGEVGKEKCDESSEIQKPRTSPRSTFSTTIWSELEF